ncbi:MAG: hypothetical protein ACJAVK_003279 [Akkermansiaceae bacterium]|jgi:hypothetical protein
MNSRPRALSLFLPKKDVILDNQFKNAALILFYECYRFGDECPHEGPGDLRAAFIMAGNSVTGVSLIFR